MTINEQRIILRMLSLDDLEKLYPIPDDVVGRKPESRGGGFNNACNDKPGDKYYFCTLHPGHAGLHVAHGAASGPYRTQIVMAWTTDHEIVVDRYPDD